MSQDFPIRGSLGAPDQINPVTQLQGDQKTPAFPIRGTQYDTTSVAQEDVLGGPLYNVDPSKFDFFLKTGEDNEELRAQDQSNLGMIAKGVGRLALTTLTKTIEGLGFVGSIPAAIATGDLNRVVDNAWSEWWANAEDSVKESMPIYHTKKYNEGNILQQAATLGFWTDDVVDGLAFFASAWLGSKGINIAAKGIKGYSGIAKLFTKATKAARKGAAPIGAQLPGMAIASEADLFTMSVGNSFVEGMFEAKDTKDTLLKQGLSNEEASKAAMGTFWWNMAALMPSNYVTNSFLFKGVKPRGGRLLREVDEATGLPKVTVKPITFRDKALNFAKGASLSVLSEGPYEENIQLAVQNYFKDRASGKESASQLEGIINNMADNFFTDEGQKSIFLGSLIGLIPGGVASVKELREEQANENRLALLMNTTIDAVRNDKAMKDVWLKTKDPRTGQETYVVGNDGKLVPDPLKLASYFVSLYNTTDNIARSLVATETGDQIMLDRLHEQTTASLALGMLYHPDGKVQFDSEIELLARNEVEQAGKTGREVNEEDINKKAFEYKARWNRYKTIYDNIVNNYAGTFNLGDTKIAEFFKQEAIKAQFMGAVDQVFWADQKRKLQAERSRVAVEAEDLEINQTEVSRLDEQIDFIDKFTASLRQMYKRLLSESRWQRIHDATVEAAKKKESGSNPPAAQTTEPVAAEPAKDIAGKEVIEEPAKTTVVEDKEVKKQEEKAKAEEEIKKPLTDEEKADRIMTKYGDTVVAGSNLSRALSDIEMFPDRGLTVFYQGELGTLFIDDVENEVVFRNEANNKETIVTKTTDTEAFEGDITLKQLGIVPLQHTVFNIELSSEMDKLIIEGREFATLAESPFESIEENENGWPMAIKLLDSKGEVVRFTNPTLVAELAYAIELIEHVKDTVSDMAFQEKGLKSDFIVITDPTNKYRKYQLYKQPNGTIDVIKVVETELPLNKRVKIEFVKVNRKTKERVLRLYYNDLSKAIEAAYAEAIKGSYREQETQNKDLRERQINAIKKSIANSRPATAKEIIGSPAASEVSTIKGREAEEKRETKVTKPEVQASKTDSGESAGVVRPKVNEVEEQIIQEVVEKQAEVKAAEPVVTEATTLTTLGIEPTEVGTEEDQETGLPSRGIVHSYSAIAYKGEDNPEFDKYVSDKQNTLGGYYLMAEIDYQDPFWEQHNKAPEVIKTSIETIHKEKDGTDSFDSFVDILPIKLVMYNESGEKTGFSNLYMHKSDFYNIVVPADIKRISDPVARKKAYEELRQAEMTKTRGVRYKVITQLLSGKKVVFSNLDKGVGIYNNGGNSKISEIFSDLTNIRIGIADSTGSIYAGDNSLMEASGTPGNVFLETKETCNGKPAIIKLNPTKVSERQAAILFEALRIAATSEHGYRTAFVGDEVEGDLTVGEVIKYLVLDGQITNQSNTEYNEIFKPHLESKQLWLDLKTGTLTYGKNKLSLRKKTLTKEETDKFIKHVTAHKNHLISINGELSLGKVIKRDFRIGDIVGKKGDTYEQFLISNGYVLTDVVKDEIVGKPFTKPVIVYDASEFESEEPAPVTPAKKIKKASEVAAKKEEEVTKGAGEKSIRLKSGVVSSLVAGSEVYSSMIGEEVAGKSDIGRIVEKDGELVLTVTDIINMSGLDKEDADALEGMKVSDPNFYKTIRRIFPGEIVMATIPQTEVAVEEKKPPVVDEEIAGAFTKSAEKKMVNYRVGDVDKAVKYLQKKFGKNIDIKLYDKLISVMRGVSGKKAFGYFSKDCIGLSRVMEVGTEYHEAFHRVERLYLSTEQRAKLYEEVRSHSKWSKLSDKQVSELLADGFEEYELSGGVDVRSFGQKVKDFFKDLWDFIKTFFTGDLHITDLEINNVYRIVSKSKGAAGRLRYTKANKKSEAELSDSGVVYEKLVKGTEFSTISTIEQLDSIAKNIIYMAFNQAGIYTIKDLEKISDDFLYTPVPKIQAKIDYIAKKTAELEQAGETNKAEAYKQLGDMFQEVVDKYDKVLDVVKDQLFVLGINVNGALDEEKEVDAEDESDMRGENFSRYNHVHLVSNLKDNAASNVKLLIATLRETEELDQYTSLHKFVDFDYAWDTFQHELQDKNSIEEMEAALSDKMGTSTMHKDLYNRLKDPKRKDSFDTLRTQFYSTMKKNRNNLVNVSVNKKTGDHAIFTVGNAETQRIALTYATAWGQAFVNSSAFEKGRPDKTFIASINKEYDRIVERITRRYNPNTGIVKDINSIKEEVIALFNMVSVPMDMKMLDNILNTKIPEAKTTDEALYLFLKHKKYRIGYIFGDKGPFHSIITSGKVFGKGKLGNKEIPLTAIYKNESVFKDVIGNAYVESHDDQRINSVLGPGGNQYYLISENSFLTDVMNDINKGGTYLNGIAGVTYAKHSLWREALADTETRENVKSFIFSSFAQEESSDIGRAFDEITKLEDYLLKVSLMDSGYIPLPQLAERGYLEAIKGLPLVDFNYIYNPKDNSLRIPKPIIKIFTDYAKDEKARIDQVKAEIAEAFKAQNTDSLVKDYHYKEVPSDREGNGEKFIHFPSFNGRKFETIDLNEEIARMLDARIEETIGEFIRLGIIKGTLGKNGRYIGLANRLLDENIINRLKQTTVDNNEGFVIKNYIAKFVVNSIVSTMESEKLFFMDPAYHSSTENKVKRASVITSTGTNMRIDFDPDVLPDDRLIHNNSFNSIILKTQKYRSEKIFEELVKKYVALGNDEEKVDEEKVREQLKGYLNVDQTDAQAYITPQMRRAIKVRMGEWSEEENEAYDLVMSGRALTSAEQRKVDKLYMEPLKLSYFGVNFTPKNGRPIMYKTSMATLTKQLVEGTQLEELYDRMQTSHDPVDVAIFDSGVKVGATKAIEYFEVDENGIRIEDNINVSDIIATDAFKLQFKFLRRQQITDPHMEQYGKMYTQFKKIILSNIVDSNEYTIDGSKTDGATLKAENFSLLGELSNRGKTKFMSVLGWDEKTNTTTDKEKERDFITDRARKANMPEQFIDALGEQVDGEYFEYDALPDRKWIQSTLIAQMGKHTIDIHMPGTALIQMSNFGLRKATKDDSLKLYDKDGYMEAKVSIEIFRNAIPGYKDMNEEERMVMANKLFVGIGYRIPTQGLNSTVPLKIVGFLPSTSTDTIALPAEFTMLTGSDFDIDKLYFIRHNYYINDNNEAERYKLEEGVALKEQKREAIENRLIDIYLGVLLSNNHLVDTKTPLDASTKAIKDLASLVETSEGTTKEEDDLFAASPLYQSLVKDKYLGGKEGIAPFALNNAHHVLGQMVDLQLPFFVGAGNITADGKTSLSGIKGKDNVPILTWLSALINAHVDIAKDPYIYSLNVNRTTYNITNLLIRSGVGGELTFSFLSQPILKEYAELSALTKGRIRSLRGKPGSLLKKKYKNLLDKAVAEEKVKKEDVAPSDNIFDKSRLLKDIASKNRKGAAYYARQLQILEKFLELNNSSYRLSEAVRASQIDTKRYGNNLMEVKAYNNLISKVLKDKAIINMDRLFNETFLRSAYDNSIALAFKMFSSNSILGTAVFNEFHERIINEMGFTYDTSRNAPRRINLIADELFGAVAGKFFVDHLGYDVDRVKGMFFGDNTISDRVLALKNDPEYKENRLVRLLNPMMGEKEEDPNLLTLFNATENRTKWHKDRIMEGWSDLLADPKYSTLAEDLVAYSFFTSGFRKSLHSFYNYIPPQYLKDIGYVDYIRSIREAFKEGSTSATVGYDMYRDVMRNLWHNSEVVPYLTPSDFSHKRPFKASEVEGKVPDYWKMVQVPQSTQISGTSMFLGENLVGEPVFRPYFKTTISGEDYIYRYIGYRYSDKSKEHVGVYTIDGKRGLKEQAGKIIKEYGLPKSIFEANNVYTVTEDDINKMESFDYFLEKDGKLIYDYSGFHAVPVDMAIVSPDYVVENPESEVEDVEATEVTEGEETDINPSDFVGNSGGAYGSDYEWGEIGKEFGVTNFKHYYHGNKTPYGNTEISKEEFDEGKRHVIEANKKLNRRPEGYMDLLARNWIQVKNSDAVYALGNINFSNNIVSGGTGWAVQMAIDSRKLVFVYDFASHYWWRYDQNALKFLKYDGAPTLTRNFAGIGTRGTKKGTTYELPEEGRAAIRAVYENTFSKPTGITPVESAKKAIVKIVPDPWAAQKRGEGISVIRGKEGSTHHYGNPFSELQRSQSKNKIIHKNSVAEAVQAYKDWLNGVKYEDIEPERRKWILDQISSGKLDGKTLLYFNNIRLKGEESHADALAQIVNSRSKETVVESPFVNVSKEAIKEVKDDFKHCK